MERSYTVVGMTCAHCVRSVTEEVGAVAGVEVLGVDLASGRLDVRATVLDDVTVAAAVAEAGYELVTP